MAEPPPTGPLRNESDKRARSTVRRSGETPRAKLKLRLSGTIPKRSASRATPRSSTIFIRPESQPPGTAANGEDGEESRSVTVNDLRFTPRRTPALNGLRDPRLGLIW